MPESYAPLRGRVQAVTIVFALMAAVCAVAVALDFAEYRLADDMIAGEPVTDAEATANDNRMMAMGLTQFGLYIAAAIVFIRWLYRAYRNMAVVEPAERRYGAGWAIGAWFVPIMNLFRPKQMINDIWRAGGRDMRDAQPGWLLLAWWLLFLVGWWFLSAVARAFRDGETLEEYRTGALLYMITDGLAVVAAVLAILVVRRSTDRLDGKAAAVPSPERAPEFDLATPERPTGVAA
jgi:Domain of unknown function (DUF4328)